MIRIILLILIIITSKINAQSSYLDNSFNIGTGFSNNLNLFGMNYNNGYVLNTAIQLDSKIIVGGKFSAYNGNASHHLIRINPNGTVDNSFNIGSGYFKSNSQGLNIAYVNATAIQTDGKIIAVGNFVTFNGISLNGISRLNSNGTIDETFNVGSGFDTLQNGTLKPLSIQIQADGKILIGGEFSMYNGVFVNNIVRLNLDGSIDNSFITGSGFDGVVRSIKLQNDGKIIIAGSFSNFNGIPKNNIVRLNIDGSIDTTFDPLTGPNSTVSCADILSNGKIIIGGNFSSFNGTTVNKIACLNNNGSLDITFNSSVGFDAEAEAEAEVYCADILSNGKIIVGGSFTSYNGISRSNIAILNNDGSLDNSFNLGAGSNDAETLLVPPTIFTLNIQNDSKIIAGGLFTAFDGVPKSKIVRVIICETPVQNTINVSQCNQYVSPLGNIYSQSGIYNETLQNLIGCDSIYSTLNVNILNSSSSSFSNSICNGDTYLWNNQSYSSSGSYTQTFQASNGCDSVVTLNLTLNPTNFNPSFSSNQQLFTSPPFAVQFSNTTINLSNYTFTWYWGDGTSTTSNNPTVFHQYLSNGLYSVTLEAVNNVTGCLDQTTLTDYIFTTGGVSCSHSSVINQVGPINGCSSQPIIITCNSDPNFTYQWRRNGVYIQGNNNDTLLVNQPGSYAVIISVNGCPVSSLPVTVNITNITPPTISSSGAIQPCLGGSVILSASLGYTNYLWSNGATTQSITVSSSGNFSVQGTGANGCIANSQPYTVNASFLPTQNICVVGVDSLTNNIRVVWEKPITTAIDSFYVYKESTVSNVYAQVGSRAYDSLSVWIDPISNPAVQAYRYKITALDTCGVETPLSDFHKTIHLTINQGVGGAWNLIWSHYEGINFGSYKIYRGASTSNMSLLTSIQSNLNSYTDLTPPSGLVYYQIEIINPNSCSPTKSTNYSLSRSNIVVNGQNDLLQISNDFISVYPNPTNGEFIIDITKGLIGEQYYITDFSGKIIKFGKFENSKEKVDIDDFSKGVFIIQIKNRNIQERIIKL